MRNKLESLPEYNTMEEGDDYVGLLRSIKELVYSVGRCYHRGLVC
jgi:hypothetical protein